MNPLPLSPEKAKLQKQIAETSQFQWLSLMPAWLPGVLSAVNHTPTPPGRQIYVALFHIGSIIFGVTCFCLVRARIGSMKRRLAQLEAGEQDRTPPPIPVP